MLSDLLQNVYISSYWMFDTLENMQIWTKQATPSQIYLARYHTPPQLTAKELIRNQSNNGIGWKNK